MRISLIALFLLLSTGISFGLNQDVIKLSKSSFQSHQKLFLAPLDGWIFKQGNDTLWANEDIDLTGWNKFKPTELSAKMEDESGRVEGWFRIKIILDKSFVNTPLAINRELWAATDVYINGKLIHSFGNTGNPYQAFNPILKYPIPLQLEVGKEYLIAIHFVDYETTFTQRELRLKPQHLKSFLNLTGPEFIDRVTHDIKQTHIYGTLSISISFVLFFLFWMLVFLNPGQKIFRIIALITTAVWICAVGSFFDTFFDLSYPFEKLRYVINISLQVVMNIGGLILLEWLLIRKTTWISVTLLFVVTSTSTFAHLFSISPPFGIAFSCMLVYFGFLLVKYWKSIHEAMWAVVAATVSPIIMAMVYINLHKYSLDLFHEYEKPLLSLMLLSSPLFLLVYISFRFKEILKDIANENHKVLLITEEKQELLSTQNERLELLVSERTTELEKSLSNLKSTQNQLIQKEKLASLGELTAGIAHEIQNPLNFVNNFSELSVDLAQELKEEIKKPEKDWELIEELTNDLSSNQEKINHHGKRASNIVKGMLEHSRTSTGERVLTDINQLADEYLRLSYHGMRAKNKEFNADYQLIADSNLPNIEVVPQEIGRVLLNLVNNAFYAVAQVSKLPGVVQVSTKTLGNAIEIRVKDNGNGIPKANLEKIFQPFFTTKPTGEGTGLGLSLSYDIITKGHGGILEVVSVEGEGAEFIVRLPV